MVEEALEGVVVEFTIMLLVNSLKNGLQLSSSSKVESKSEIEQVSHSFFLSSHNRELFSIYRVQLICSLVVKTVGISLLVAIETSFSHFKSSSSVVESTEVAVLNHIFYG